MSKQNKEEKTIQANPTYTVKRHNSGYAIFDQTNKRLTEEDMFPIIMKKLETILRKQLGI